MNRNAFHSSRITQDGKVLLPKALAPKPLAVVGQSRLLSTSNRYAELDKRVKVLFYEGASEVLGLTLNADEELDAADYSAWRKSTGQAQVVVS